MRYQEKPILKFSWFVFKKIKCNHFAGLVISFGGITFAQLMVNKYKTGLLELTVHSIIPGYVQYSLVSVVSKSSYENKYALSWTFQI